MKRAGWCAVACVLVVAAVVPAMAATGDPIQGYIAIGSSHPLGDAADLVKGGLGFSGGMIWNFTQSKPFGVRFDLGFNRWEASQSAVKNIGGTGAAFVDGGYANMWTLTADVLWNFGRSRDFRGYIGVGVGGYRRYAALTNDVTQIGYICDPWWGCYYAPVTGTHTVAHDTLNKLGFNSSIGMTFAVGTGELYMEARYHYMDTPEATEFVPILIGYRF